MKRDMDLIRRIALALQELDGSQGLSEMEGVGGATFAAHVQWMQEAGLVDAWWESRNPKLPAAQLRTAEQAIAFRLTWAGCEFAQAMQDPSMWEGAKKSVMQKGASWTTGVLLDWLKAEISKGLPTLGN